MEKFLSVLMTFIGFAFVTQNFFNSFFVLALFLSYGILRWKISESGVLVVKEKFTLILLRIMIVFIALTIFSGSGNFGGLVQKSNPIIGPLISLLALFVSYECIRLWKKIQLKNDAIDELSGSKACDDLGVTKDSEVKNDVRLDASIVYKSNPKASPTINLPDASESFYKQYRNHIYIFLYALMGVFVYFSFIHNENHPADFFKDSKLAYVKQVEIDGVKLGDSLRDVLFKNKGFTRLNDGKSIEGEESYFDKDRNMRIEIESGRVKTILSICNENDLSLIYNNISCGDSSELILSSFASNVRVLCNKHEQYKNELRRYDVVKYGTSYILSYNKVSAVRISESKIIDDYTKNNWEPCF